jgi:lysozyme
VTNTLMNTVSRNGACPMKMTDEGLALIKRFEGFRSQAYRDATGVWTVGYGHTSMAGSPAVAAGLTVTRQQAGEILAADVDKFARQVEASLHVKLTDSQFAALVSFAYNVGVSNFRSSSVLRAVNARDFAAVPRRLQLWNKAGGRALPGLVARRAAEAQLFLKDESASRGPAPLEATPVQVSSGKPASQSTTTLAAVISAMAGIASTLMGSAREAADIFGAKGIGLLLMAVMVGAALWIIRERRRKALDEGI